MLKGRVAVVTGGLQGIGEAVVKLFQVNGAVAVVGDISSRFECLTVSENGFHEKKLDVSDKKNVEAFMGEVFDAFGRIDILVNNAGICRDIQPEFEEVPEEEWRKILDVNLGGMVHCTGAVLPHMRKRKYGRIINLASIAGEIGGSASSAAYSASKAAVICTTKVLARLEGPNNITANCIAPGYIITEMTKSHVHDLSGVPLRRRGEAVDVAYAALYLASDMGSYVTGTTIDVNGGAFMK